VGKTPSIAGKECNPIFHANYRSMFIVIISLVTSFFLVTAMLLLNQDVSFNTFITGYFIAMTGSFLYLNKQQKCIANNRLELLGQLAMLLLFASVGIWISALALYISSNQLIAGLLMVVWHIIIMQPQFLRRLQFVFFRGQLAG
jgi:hypothetical protein